MSVLFPDQQSYGPDWQQGVICRPTPIGGCIQFMHYDRYLSNRLKEYGPFDRLIDISKLQGALTLVDIYGPDQTEVVLKVSIMGVVIPDRPTFEGQIYPALGLSCPTPSPASS
jgi:hypothetical protein